MPRRLHTLKIVTFRNPGGSAAFRITGRFLGEQVRKNFASRSEALGFFDEKTRGLAEVRAKAPVMTSLSADEVHAIEAAQLRLPPGATVSAAVDFYAKHFKPLSPLKWAEAGAGYRVHLREERKTEDTTAARMEAEVVAFGKFASEKNQCATTDRVTRDISRAWIYAEGLDPRTQRDRYDRLNQVCAWLVGQRHATFNPVAELIRPKVRVRAPAILTPTQIQRLLDAAWSDAEGPAMLPHFAITLLSGVRPGECRRLADADIHLDSEHPGIEVNLAKGGRSRRIVDIAPPLAGILKKCRALKLAPGYFSVRKFNRIRRAVGLYEVWTKDISRHSYASYRYELDRDIDGLVKNMGNSAKVLFTNYVRAVPKKDALTYDRIAPNWSTPRQRTLEGRRVDLWAKLPDEVLTSEQTRAVARYRATRSG